MRTCTINNKRSIAAVVLTLCIGLISSEIQAQYRNVTKTRILAGLSWPEFFHAGISHDLSRSNQVGMNAGMFYSPGTSWPSMNLEHRLYLGVIDEVMGRKRWYFRQGITWLPSRQDVVGSLSVGLDLKSRNNYKGWTVDLGLSGYLSQHSRADLYYARDYSYRYIPTLRVQHFMYFSRKK